MWYCHKFTSRPECINKVYITVNMTQANVIFLNEPSIMNYNNICRDYFS